MAEEKRKHRAKFDARRPHLNLSMREMRFAAGVAEHDNQTKAYREAGYSTADMSEETMRKYASALAAKPDVDALIADMRREALEANRVTVNRVASNLSDQAFSDKSGVYDEKGNSLPPAKLPKELRSQIRAVFRVRMHETKVTPQKGDQPAKIENVRWWEYRYVFCDPFEARALLARWRGMVGERDEVGTDSEANVPKPLVVAGEANPAKLLAIEGGDRGEAKDAEDVPGAGDKGGNPAHSNGHARATADDAEIPPATSARR